ncbi:uncharacterized protein LOC104582968 isoform X2 [Brachypodium distachyon]|uniref:uncharacterized protein LOC104582968 isoform X2 n=1 Tax=Brachypodium distachyon TaxID=15368 RepID=UPI000D0D5D2B|nr:uncharacterized protein LOC104582968 isoform X2 [Brachypodium distachyon]|eukprot:XP_024315378.1 uncharacterized protein LOC104582968 isoform X2 [Brachypodium distachyon]
MSVEEVKQMLAAATSELEAARQEVRRKEQNIAALVELLRRTAEERDQLQRQQQHLLLAHDPAAVATPSSSDSHWSLTPSSSSPVAVDSSVLFQPTSASNADVIVDNTPVLLEPLATKRPLPQQGQLLKAVMEAGPLLQNLMVAGPLPRWRNPPPARALPSPVIPAVAGSRAPMG